MATSKPPKSTPTTTHPHYVTKDIHITQQMASKHRERLREKSITDLPVLVYFFFLINLCGNPYHIDNI